VHVFDPARFPFRPEAPYHPVSYEHGTAADLAAVLDASGVDQVVLVNPTSGYGDDNACMLDALRRLGPRARGIARVPFDTSSRALAALAGRGVVGIRIDFVAAGFAPLADPAFEGLLARLAELDLLLDVQAEGEQWSALAPRLRRHRGRIVVDHLGRPDPARGVRDAAFRALVALADTGRVVVKLSGAMRASKRPPPHADLDPFVSALVRAYTPAGLVWGSDWPFLRTGRRTDYAPFLARFASLVDDARARRAILSRTPARVFGFIERPRRR
jgi:predicted TIM-barrel fold metal-dependent hydrolase